MPPSSVASIIDHTRLAPDATRAEIEALCAEATAYRFATVCVNPIWVSMCTDLLRGSGVSVCSVAGFPLGAVTTDMKRYETERAIAQGAGEIDMVANIGLLKSGEHQAVQDDIAAVTAVCGAAGVVSKVIIETALLTDEEKVEMCRLAQAAGATFVKTSTGFAAGGATAADVGLMRRVVGPDMGIKASGGIRDLATLRMLVAAGATRIGTSAGVRIAREALGELTA